MSRFTELQPESTGLPLRNLIRVAVLVALAATVGPATQRAQTSTNHTVGIVLLGVAVAGWVAWLASRDRDYWPGVVIGLVLLAGAGGALAPGAPEAIAFSAVVGVGAGMAFELPFASVLAIIGPLAHLISAAVQGDSYLDVLGSTAAALAGLMVGLSRLQATRATEQRALMEVERERALVEHERAELLAERNRLAREIHDVLAHTLGAVSVQLEALDAVVNREDPALVHDRVQATRGLVVQGLVEARRAVAALRDDAVPLPQQLKELGSTAGADVTIGGEQQPLSPPATSALFRIAQEGLTNAAKHAPGAAARVTLQYGEDTTALEVRNAHADAPGPMALQGGGYGLQGMRERVLLLGGTLEAGPTDDGGWLVRASVPT